MSKLYGKKVLVVPYDSGDVGFDDQDEESDQSVQNDQGHAPNIEPCRTPNYPDLKKKFIIYSNALICRARQPPASLREIILSTRSAFTNVEDNRFESPS